MLLYTLHRMYNFDNAWEWMAGVVVHILQYSYLCQIVIYVGIN